LAPNSYHGHYDHGYLMGDITEDDENFTATASSRYTRDGVSPKALTNCMID